MFVCICMCVDVCLSCLHCVLPVFFLQTLATSTLVNPNHNQASININILHTVWLLFRNLKFELYSYIMKYGCCEYDTIDLKKTTSHLLGRVEQEKMQKKT